MAVYGLFIPWLQCRSLQVSSLQPKVRSRSAQVTEFGLAVTKRTRNNLYARWSKLTTFRSSLERSNHDHVVHGAKWPNTSMVYHSKALLYNWPVHSSSTAWRVSDSIPHMGLILKVIPSKLFLNHSRFRKSQKGLEIANPVALFTWIAKVTYKHAWNHPCNTK